MVNRQTKQIQANDPMLKIKLKNNFSLTENYTYEHNS